MPRGDLRGALANDQHLRGSLETRISIAKDIALGMHFLHSHNPSVIHRDLRTPNCLVYDLLSLLLSLYYFINPFVITPDI